MPDIGRHLLGRIPSPPDARDYEMRKALESEYRSFFEALFSLLKKLFPFIFGDEPTPPVPPDPDAPPMDSFIAWLTGRVLNQANTPHCVGFSGAAWENAEPVPFNFENEEGHRLYYLCKDRDGEPREENGTWVRSLAEVLREDGRIADYYFANTDTGETALEEVRRWLRAYGPVVFGTDWYDDMFYPDSRGYVSATGGIAGGHAYLLVGDDPATKTLLFQNSWDSDWGDGGFFRMTYTTTAKLLAADGEAMGTTELIR